MNQAHQQALEAFIGKALTAEQIEELTPYLEDPDNRNDVKVTEILSRGRTALGEVSTPRFASWCAASGMRAVIEDHCSDKASPLRSMALTLRDVLNGAATSISFDDPGNAQMLDAWVSAGACTEQWRNVLLQLATKDAPYDMADVSLALNKAEKRLTF